MSTQPQAGTPPLEPDVVVVWWCTTVAPGSVVVSVVVFVLDRVTVLVSVDVFVSVRVLVSVRVGVVVVVLPVVFVFAALVALASAPWAWDAALDSALLACWATVPVVPDPHPDTISTHATIAAPTRGGRAMNLAR